MKLEFIAILYNIEKYYSVFFLINNFCFFYTNYYMCKRLIYIIVIFHSRKSFMLLIYKIEITFIYKKLYIYYIHYIYEIIK